MRPGLTRPRRDRDQGIQSQDRDLISPVFRDQEVEVTENYREIHTSKKSKKWGNLHGAFIFEAETSLRTQMVKPNLSRKHLNFVYNWL